jgi:tetratricopeptide (TPR) repeat protein
LAKAVELTPQNERAHLALSRAYLEQKQMDKAQREIARAEELNADHPELPFYRGLLNASRQNFAEAAQDLEKALEADPHNADAHYYAGLAYGRLKKPDKMVEHLQMYLKLEPEGPNAAKVRSLLRSM